MRLSELKPLTEDFVVNSFLICLLFIALSCDSPQARMRRHVIDQLEFLEYHENQETNNWLKKLAKAESWNFISQEDKFVETGNSESPYLYTTSIAFYNPHNSDVFRVLEFMLIWDYEEGDWILLTRSLKEINSESKQLFETIYAVKN